MAAAMRKEEADADWSNGFYGLVEMKGNPGGGFKMRVAAESGSPY